MNKDLQEYLNLLDKNLSSPDIDAFAELKKVFDQIKDIEAKQGDAGKFDSLDKSEYLVFSLFFDRTKLYQNDPASLFIRDYQNDVSEALAIFEKNKEEILKYWRNRAQTVKSKILMSQYWTLVIKYTESNSLELDEVKALSQTNIDFFSSNSHKESLNSKLILLTEALNLALFFSMKKDDKINSFFRGAFISGIDLLDANKDTILTDGWKYYSDVLIEFLFIRYEATDFLEKPILQRVTNQFDFLIEESFKNFLFSKDNLEKKLKDNPKPSDFSVERYEQEYENAVGFRFQSFSQKSIFSIKDARTKDYKVLNALFAARRFFLKVFSQELERLKLMITYWFEKLRFTLKKQNICSRKVVESSGDLTEDIDSIARHFIFTPEEVKVPPKYLEMPPFLMLINKYAFSYSHPDDFRNWVTWAVLINGNQQLEKSSRDFKKRNPNPLDFYNIFASEPFFDEWTKLPDEQNVLKRSLEKYWKGEYVESITLILSLFEQIIRRVVALEDGNWIDFSGYGVLKVNTLGSLLSDGYDSGLIDKFFRDLTPMISFHLKNLLVYDTGFNLRNTLAHGIGDERVISLEDSSNWFFQLLCIFTTISISQKSYQYFTRRRLNKELKRKNLIRRY